MISTEDGLEREEMTASTTEGEIVEKEKEQVEEWTRRTNGHTTVTTLTAITSAIEHSLSVKHFRNTLADKLVMTSRASDTCSRFMIVFHLLLDEARESLILLK